MMSLSLAWPCWRPNHKNISGGKHAITALALDMLIDAVENHPVEKRRIFVSTCSNYSVVEKDEAVDENYTLTPLSLYAKHKVEMEKKIMGLKGKVGFIQRSSALRRPLVFLRACASISQ